MLPSSVMEHETWWGDEITPAIFRDELSKISGNLTVWLNSPGGDVFAASQIYTMLRNHKGKVTVKIDGIAASAASVVAMAGDETLIAPTGMLMIHNPATFAMGNKADLEQAIVLLEEVKESIINAYEEKTHLSRAKLAHMMDEETWLNAKKAESIFNKIKEHDCIELSFNWLHSEDYITTLTSCSDVPPGEYYIAWVGISDNTHPKIKTVKLIKG